jgi:hypothetical protein
LDEDWIVATYNFTDVEAKKNFARNKGVRWFKASPASIAIAKPSLLRRLITCLEKLDARTPSGEPALSDAELDLAFNKIKHQRVFTPVVSPAFKIQDDWNVYAIGSCFARGVEKAMIADGFNVVSAAKDFEEFERTHEGVQQLGFTNKYTTHSILNELKWALVPGEDCPENSVVDLEGGISVDPHINPTLTPAGREETLRRRALITDVQRRITSCQLVVITLGLVECWKDNEADTFLNMSPTKDMMDKYPGRYSLHVLGYHENKENLDQIYDILKEYGHPDLHIIVTVSPVPLLATFTGRDVVIANTYSKSVLRVVAEEWAVDKDDVGYFPSFEIVNNSQRDVAWANDLRHVQPEVVNSIMNQLVECYVK